MTNDIFGECDCSSCNEGSFLREQEEFSRESRRVKLGMMSFWDRKPKKDWYFAPRGLAKYPWDEKALKKKKPFKFAR